MKKPRIVLADLDETYVIPLQLKWAEDYFDQVDLEIVTDQGYFDELFSTPQSIDILIISESLYDSSLHKHQIGHTFLMTEQYEEEKTDILNVCPIYKYTSLKEIFNEIIGNSSDIFRAEKGSKAESQIIVVYSAAGGVGKTTVALGMAAGLTQNYKRVLYINASWLQSFHRMLSNKTPITSSDVYAKLSNPSESIYDDLKHVLRKELFTYLPPFKAALMSLGLKYSVYEAIAKSAKKSTDFDYIIVDADTEFDDEKASLINVADKVVIVTKQSASSVYATNCLAENINGVTNDKYSFICNDYKKEEDNAIISPDFSLKFSVNEYIEHMDHFNNLRCEDYSKSAGIQRTTFLVM